MIIVIAQAEESGSIC